MMNSADTFATAVSLRDRGRLLEAERLYRRLARQTNASEADYNEWVRGLAETCAGLGRFREAGHVFAFLQRWDEAHHAFLACGANADAARTRELQARSAKAGQGQALFQAAAREYEAAALPVHAAICYSQGGAAPEARRVWEHVLRDPRLAGRPYEQALCAFNLGRAARQSGDGSAQRLLARAQQLLEEAADDFEGRGDRERASDCYSILLQLGRDENSFENLAEGYTNCIRIFKEDNLKFYVLHYYEDFLRLAEEREEFHAAASIAREAADYVRRMGMLWDRGYLQRSAAAWWRAAEKNERDGGPVELTENAYLGSVDSFSALGDFHRVRETYERLAKLALPEAKKERYERVAARYVGVAQAPIEIPQFPEYLHQQHAYPAIWELDMAEWELDGDYAAVCSGIAGDRRYASMIRRRALQALLVHLEPGIGDGPRLLDIAIALGELCAYAALRPLEKLYESPDESVRRNVMRACKTLYYKRTFHLLQRGLQDDSKMVFEAALDCLESLHFVPAFDPLVRIVRDHPDTRVKVAALTSIGAISTLQAGEFLIEVLRYEGPPLRDVARRLLAGFGNPEIFPILKRYIEVEHGPSREDLLRVLRGMPATP